VGRKFVWNVLPRSEQVSTIMRQNRIRLTGSLLLISSVAGLVVGVTAAQKDPRAFFVLAAFECAIGLAFMLIRCEYCQRPVHRRSHTVFGVTISTWSVGVPRRCLGCDAPIPWWGPSSKKNSRPTTDVPSSPRGDRNRAVVVVLAFLAATNFVGGIGLALVVDHRLIWIAVVIPCAAIGGIFLARRSQR
jgi:uncharacterized membrane protein YfcA